MLQIVAIILVFSARLFQMWTVPRFLSLDLLDVCVFFLLLLLMETTIDIQINNYKLNQLKWIITKMNESITKINLHMDIPRLP